MGMALKLDRRCRVFALTLFILLSACTGEGGDTLEGRGGDDGAEILTLMGRARASLANGDKKAFEALFSREGQDKAGNLWLDLYDDGGAGTSRDEVLLLTAPPELARAFPNLPVNGLVLQLWFDLSPLYEDARGIYRTHWALRRSEANPRWRLESLRIERSSVTHGPLIGDLNRLRQWDFLALEMEWEDAMDPTPLLVDALNAMAAHDLEALKACTVDGALFYAWRNGISLPSVVNDESYRGKRNRKESLDYLERQVRDLHLGMAHLRVPIGDLVPYFTAYGILSMPRDCTKLKLAIEFDGRGLSPAIKSLTVAWAAARLNQKWLVESLAIETVKGYR